MSQLRNDRTVFDDVFAGGTVFVTRVAFRGTGGRFCVPDLYRILWVIAVCLGDGDGDGCNFIIGSIGTLIYSLGGNRSAKGQGSFSVCCVPGPIALKGQVGNLLRGGACCQGSGRAGRLVSLLDGKCQFLCTGIAANALDYDQWSVLGICRFRMDVIGVSDGVIRILCQLDRLIGNRNSWFLFAAVVGVGDLRCIDFGFCNINAGRNRRRHAGLADGFFQGAHSLVDLHLCGGRVFIYGFSGSHSGSQSLVFLVIRDLFCGT